MQTTRLPLVDTLGLGIFALMARALTPAWVQTEKHQRSDAAPIAAPAPRPGLLDRLDTWFWRIEQRALEAHLSKAVDVYDLEARIRDLERGGRYRCY
jgi:hypothetical protein